VDKTEFLNVKPGGTVQVVTTGLQTVTYE